MSGRRVWEQTEVVILREFFEFRLAPGQLETRLGSVIPLTAPIFLPSILTLR